ncbi:thioredoxin family protein [Flexithrix dorotheae]|uniref:thioredoxin family protein n=1 Tax=Flexithrix dorotheae TaxID=70993 RepID=UPI000370E925|nr:thioredoxin family protein [Flexithrix dorotheae]
MISQLKSITTLTLAFFLFAFFTPENEVKWLMDYDQARLEAKQNDKIILLYFSGSDWCKPCIQLKKEVFESSDFKAFAENKFILVQLDFPRLKKNRLPAPQVKHNESLAKKYNPKGEFPLVVLLNSNEEIIGKTNYNGAGADAFISTLNAYLE